MINKFKADLNKLNKITEKTEKEIDEINNLKILIRDFEKLINTKFPDTKVETTTTTTTDIDAKADIEYLGTPEISKIEIGTINNIVINGDLYQFKTKDGLISGVMISPTEFRIDGISANEVGKGQGSKMFETLIRYLKAKGVKTLKTESAGEGAIKMHNKAVDKGLLTKVKEDGRFAIFTINNTELAALSTTDTKTDVTVVPENAESSDDAESPAVESGQKTIMTDDPNRYTVEKLKSDLEKVTTKEE